MTLVRWEPARELHSLQQEMNRLFGSAFDSPSSPAASAQRQWIPAMDLVETDSRYMLRADLPGLREEDVKIELEENVLTISGERQAPNEQRAQGCYRIERASGSFARSLTLPQGIDPEGIEASFTNGVLEVRIPKPQRQKPHRVAIGLSGGGDTVEGTESAVTAAG